MDHEDGKLDHGDEAFRPVFKDEPLLYILYWTFCICCCCCGFGRQTVLKLRVIVLRIFAVLFMILSLIVISAEVTVIADGQQSVFGYAVRENPDNELGIFVLTFLVFGYMSLCTWSRLSLEALIQLTLEHQHRYLREFHQHVTSDSRYRCELKKYCGQSSHESVRTSSVQLLSL